MTSFLDILTHKYKQLLINFGYDKIAPGAFVIAGNECENTKEILEETGAAVKLCNGKDPVEEVMEIIDRAELPHCFLVNLNHSEPEKTKDIDVIQDIFKVASKKLMRTHLYVFNVNKHEASDNLSVIVKDLKSISRNHKISKFHLNDKEVYNLTSNFGEDYQLILIEPPFLDV